MPTTSDRQLVQLPAARYIDATAQEGPWEIACRQQGRDGHTVVTGVSERPVDETTAAALGIEPGSTAIYRGNQMFLGEQIAQLQDTWLPLSLVTGTALAAPEKAVGGIYRALADIGHPPATADEVVTGRMPTSEEAALLQLGAGSPVLEIRRTTCDSHGQALVHTRVVVAADRITLTYQQAIETPELAHS